MRVGLTPLRLLRPTLFFVPVKGFPPSEERVFSHYKKGGTTEVLPYFNPLFFVLLVFVSFD